MTLPSEGAHTCTSAARYPAKSTQRFPRPRGAGRPRWHTQPVSGLPTINILGLEYACLDEMWALDEAERLYKRDEPAWIAVENVHGVNLALEDRAHQDLLSRADLLLNDGKGVMLAARLLGRRFPVDLNGNYFGPMLLRRAARRGWPVFFLGAAPGVAERAVERVLDEIPGLNVVGTHHGYFRREEEPTVLERVRSSGARLLFVGMGNPLQEQWLDRNIHASGARLGVTVGAFLDFQAGQVRRAPGWMNRLGLEWVFRLLTEPKRLWRRYLIGNPTFVWRVVRQRLGRAPEPAPPRDRRRTGAA